MAKRTVIIVGDEQLRKKSRTVTVFDDKLAVLLDDMADTMYAKQGVGLAAPQISILKRVIVTDDGSGLKEFINPVIDSQSDYSVMTEGCLSVPKRWGDVSRPNKIEIEYDDRNGEHHKETFEGFEARIISHETDHLDGILFIDKLEPETEQ